MSNTGRKKKLASFNCDQKMWSQFIARCKDKGTTATATLTSFIELYLDDSQDDLDAIAGHDSNKNLDFRIKASIEEYLSKYLVPQVDKYLAASHSSGSTDSETILAICSRLEQLELGTEQFNNKETPSTEYPTTDLEQKIESITARMTQLSEAIVKIQNYLNKQPKRSNRSYNKSYSQGYTQRLQPLTEEGLASRLGVNVETLREQRVNLPPPLFVSWCKGKDRSSIGWEFFEDTGLYYAVS
jgi:hypothetical protein